ncbi:MAG: NADH-quinone oxidoreductase subunit C [Puniceicoccaceae bacterium MED-G30]|jgi:NADH-quinone oxidoreductase subunit C|nr:MAG: NADH-quinone oxidoreductase subunit C [Puniceicoccaceae bacterium MED-G30]RPG84471.1 MAG: NADH-quinone oxidoreductase subunit C [Coraliomargarita sp. TMED73]|tara:strand:- start:4117 stop:4725 length:609 start_codon:yes stop_codon:yes gene_type:complete
MKATDFTDLVQRFDFLTERESADHLAVNCPADRLLELATALRDELAYDLLLDVTAVDWDAEHPRFTGVYHLYTTERHEYLRIAANCTDDIEPTLPSLSTLYPAANWHERETYDLMGIRYEGHPDLSRILMWDDYPYHPLRKEFPLAGIETPLPADDVAAQTNAKVLPAPMMGGPFVAPTEGPMSQAEPLAKDESWTEKEENQ